MKRDFTVLGKSTFHPLASHLDVSARDSEQAAVIRSGEYSEHLLRLFQRPSAVVVTASGADVGQIGICESLGAELAASGKKVVVVPVDRLLLAHPACIIDEISLVPGVAPNVWLWPSSAQQLEVFTASTLAEGENWLQRLRRTFHTVILDCPPLETASEVSQLSAFADATILVVEAHRTNRQQIRNDQLALELKGAKIAGCILVRGR